MEELEAVDCYNRCVDAGKSQELKAMLAHNRNEEKERVAMLLEWSRKQESRFDKEPNDDLFKDKPGAHK